MLKYCLKKERGGGGDFSRRFFSFILFMCAGLSKPMNCCLHLRLKTNSDIHYGTVLVLHCLSYYTIKELRNILQISEVITFSPFVSDEQATGSHLHYTWWFPLKYTEGRTLHAASIPSYCQTPSIHCLQKGHLVIWLVIIYFPSPSREEELQKRGVCSEELHHHTGVCCKLFIHS